MQDDIRPQFIERRCQSALHCGEPHRQNARVKRDGEPRETLAVTALQLTGEGHGGIGWRAGKGAESSHENLDHDAFPMMEIARNCFGPILVTFPVQKTCEQRGSLTFRQAIPCLMGAATQGAAVIPED